MAGGGGFDADIDDRPWRRVESEVNRGETAAMAETLFFDQHLGGFADPGIADFYAMAGDVDGVFAALEAAPSPRRPSHPERL